MDIESQVEVCSFDLSKKLKKLGVKQTAYWKWTSIICLPPDKVSEEKFSAFTIAELGDILPTFITDKNLKGNLFIAKGTKDASSWVVGYSNYAHQITPCFVDTNLANAFATILIYLIENNLININKEST